jgi:ABC-type antimicrobial peptide transport system ATPase subunit
MKHSGVTEMLPEPAKSAVSRLASRLEAFQNTQILLIGPDFDLR